MYLHDDMYIYLDSLTTSLVSLKYIYFWGKQKLRYFPNKSTIFYYICPPLVPYWLQNYFHEEASLSGKFADLSEKAVAQQ